MTLTLRIDNYDMLQDGGPTFVTVSGAGLQVGRSTAMDWTLPDPERHISSHHFDVDFRDGAYWLRDTSTNGVFLEGQRHRIDGAHRLQHGDRFQVGHYYITAELSDAAPQASPQAGGFGAAPQPSEDGDPWSLGGPADPIDPMPRQPAQDPFADFSSDFIVSPSQGSHAPSYPADMPSAASPMPAAAPYPGARPDAQANPAMAGMVDDAAIVRAFCEGAGLPADAYHGADATVLARELGRTMRVTAQELMTMLQDRASAKKFTKGGERTMMGSSQNNPLKFLPDAAEALEVMFLKPRPGFMEGGGGVDQAMGDLRTHQMAIFAAIQPALIKLLADLSPEAIEDAAGGGLLGGGSKKAWELFVQRWDAKVAENENGMLDAFLTYFAESYVTAVSAARK